MYTENGNKKLTENVPENIRKGKPTKTGIELSPEAQKIKCGFLFGCVV